MWENLLQKNTIFYVPPTALSLYQEEQGLPAENLTFEAENYLFSSHFFAYLFPNAKETIDGNSSDFINHLVIENKELKQCLKQIRNQCEMAQEKMYTAAREKSYYVPAEKASMQEIEHVKSILNVK